MPISDPMTEPSAPTAEAVRAPTPGELAELLSDLPDPVLVADLGGNLQWANRAAERFFGRTLEESGGMNGIDLVHPDDVNMALVSLANMQTERVGLPLELRMAAADGWRQVEIVGSSRGDRLLISVRDLTDRRRWEVAQDGTALLGAVLQHIATVAMVVDPNGLIRATSAAATRLLEIDQMDLEGRHLTSILPGKHRQAVGVALHEVLAADTGTSVTLDVEAYRADRSQVPVAVTMVNLVDDPTVGGLVVTLNDISRRSQAEHDVLESNAVLSATLESVSDGIVAVDLDGAVRVHNPQYLDILGIPEDIVDDHLAVLAHVRGLVADPDDVEARMRAVHDSPSITYEDALELEDGRVIERRSRPRVVDGEWVGRVWSFRDITETRRMQAELARQALHDPMTGLANQVLFRQQLESALLAATPESNVAAMYVDLDDFKAVNDTLGHAAGDLLLKEVAIRLRETVRTDDIVARLGGDEFAIVLVDLDGDEAAIEVARRLMEVLAKPIDLEPESVLVGASIGVAMGAPDLDHEALLRHADLAMYHAKRSGRNQFRLFTPDMPTNDGQRILVDPRLRGAGDRGELVVHYQPIVEPSLGNAVVAAEALVRWQHPERGLVMPGEFIPYAEATGIIDELGMHVLEQACRDARNWQDELGAAAPLVSVNLSPHQLLDEDLPERVAQVVADTGLDPEKLVLEFTESALMQDPGTVVRQIRQIRRKGVHLAIDDFGTGHSSLARLQQFPIDSLKIDRSFVQNLGSRTGVSLVRAIVQLAHTLGMVTVAEGVETVEQQRRLDDLGADLSQGFLFHRPGPPERVADLVSEQMAGSSEPAQSELAAPLR